MTATITVGSGPAAVAFSPDGSTAYVSDNGSGTVSVINTATGTVTATITVAGDLRDLAVTPDGSTVYVAGHAFAGASDVYAISTATNTVTSTFPVGDHPGAVEFTPFSLSSALHPIPQLG